MPMKNDFNGFVAHPRAVPNSLTQATGEQTLRTPPKNPGSQQSRS
jgi:hypothetical protein